jgi:hypothetical protein
MSSPEFIPQLVPDMTWASIGNGAAHDLAVKLAQQSMDAFTFQAQAEMMFPGGYAASTASSLSTTLARQPFPGVSEGLVYATAFHHAIQIRPTQIRVNLGEVTERPVTVGPLARNRAEFEKWCAANGVAAGEAVA